MEINDNNYLRIFELIESSDNVHHLSQSDRKLLNLASTVFESKKIKEPEINPPKHQFKYIPTKAHRLVKGAQNEGIKFTQEQWFVDQAIKLSQIDRQDLPLETKKKIEEQILNAFSTAASTNEIPESYEIQTTALFMNVNGLRYHRSTENPLLDKVHKAYVEDLGLKDPDLEELLIVHSPFFREVLAREFPLEGLDLRIDSEEKFTILLEKLIETAFEDTFNDKNGDDLKIVIDFTGLLIKQGKLPSDIYKIRDKFEQIFLKVAQEKAAAELQKRGVASGKKIERSLNNLLAKIKPVAFTMHKEQHLLLMPKFLEQPQKVEIGPFEERDWVTDKLVIKKEIKIDNSRSASFKDEINNVISRTGYRPAPHEAVAAWIRVQDIKSIMKALKIPVTSLATKGATIPIVCENYQALLKSQAMTKFKALKDKLPNGSEPAPYLKVLSDGTARLLEGLADSDIDRKFKEEGLTDLLQISYFRLLNALSEATLRKDEVEFANQMQIIHQIIQDIITIVEPYDEHALGASINKKLREGAKPVVPNGLEIPKIHLMPSAMHSLTSALGGVEAQKGTNKLNVILLNDSYYESSHVLSDAKTYDVTSLDGDLFNERGIEKALKQEPKPVDLFLCEFHHNISFLRKKYAPENILAQVKAMVDKKLVAEKFTVVIDTTINLEQSEEVRLFLQDDLIQKLIKEGKLNVVLIRSAQKFDMLGMDNYYGGIVTSINNSEAFAVFNKRMAAPEDQLGGLNYQGMTHLQSCGGSIHDQYRQGIMKNTQTLYQLLPKAMIYNEESKNLVQIAQNEDPNNVFIDINFGDYDQSMKAFSARLVKFAEEEGIPLSRRASFGFPNSNLVKVKSNYRFTPGLEGEDVIKRYAAFFHALQKKIEDVTKEHPELFNNRSFANVEERDELLAKVIENLNI